MSFKNDTNPQKLVKDSPKCTIWSVILKKVSTLGGGPAPLPNPSPARSLHSLAVPPSCFLNPPKFRPGYGPGAATSKYTKTQYKTSILTTLDFFFVYTFMHFTHFLYLVQYCVCMVDRLRENGYVIFLCTREKGQTMTIYFLLDICSISLF